MFKHMRLLCLLVFAAISLCACQGTLHTFVLQDLAGSAPSAPPEALPGDLSFLSFAERSSSFKRVQSYDFVAANGASAVYFWMANEDEPYAVTVDDAWVDALTNIVRQNNMIQWDGFVGRDTKLLDGTSFSMKLEFSDGTAVNASGYGRFPKNYGDASKAIDAHFLQLLPEEMRDW